MVRHKKAFFISGVIFFVFFVIHNLFSLFPINKVKIKNNFVNTVPQDLQADVQNVLKIQKNRGFFALNINKIKDFVKENNPWIEQIIIKKVWPNTIEIYLTEKNRLGLFNNEIITDKCELIKTSSQTIEEDNDSIVFIGPENKAKEICELYYKLNLTAAQNNLELKKVIVDKNNSWKILLNNNITCFFGSKDVENRAISFFRYYNSIIKRYPKISYIDMRYSHGMALG